MSAEPVVGRVYTVASQRKGVFTGKLVSFNDEWATVLITSGKANAAMEYNERHEGEEVTVRRSLATLTEVSPPAFPHGRPVATFWPRRGIYYDGNKPQPPIGGDPGHMSWTEAIAAGLAIADGHDGLVDALAAVDAAAYARAMDDVATRCEGAGEAYPGDTNETIAAWAREQASEKREVNRG